MRLLQVNNLKTTFHIEAGHVQAVRGITFHINKGESIGIVGESGSGKSVSMLSIMGLLPDNASIEADSLIFDGLDLMDIDYKRMRKMQGNDIGMIFQDPMTSLNPLFTIGQQIMEPIRIHQKLSKAEAKKKAIEILKLVEIPSPESRLNQYPHEFSGGMRQRVMIAIAISCNPKLLIADEPTTALDVTIQAQILDLMNDLKNKLDTSIVMVTHDLGVVAKMCTRVMVMYGGTIVEEGSIREVFYNPQHPYTWGLLRSIPKVSTGEKRKLIPIPGSPPDLIAPPKGCPFTARCEHAMKICEQRPAQLVHLTETHRASCWLMHPKAPKVQREVSV
ncbi:MULTISPECIES: ABC transporter ATP-binding protein [Bacillaceae]|uniref:ABC transporter ATP-binding protein n=1 Tax=Bacillaceae TaxID=186817 RepID=UPI000BA673CD|nr:MULTISPECIES: ABC transporter ATP-binding protein [Bacillaceae]PAE26650.1 peptide ABC transporter ATP-binding protein [Bacillus sp. 7894-2]URM31566.1 ABC transporter ATP-binding protein [Cytobacillus firmus]